jgi:hypothetical protein
VVYKYLDEEDLEIIIMCFPSKTTHKCQPLDVVIFSSVEHAWQDICEKYLHEGTQINHFTTIPAYICGTHKAMSKNLITKAFEKTGLYPVNHKVFQPQDFAPSRVSSTIAHVPKLFPHVPSSDPIEPSEDDADEDFNPRADNNSNSN